MRGSMCFSPLVPVLSSLSACQMPSKPCAQLDFAAIIANISRPINSYQAANNPRLGGKTVAYTSGAKCVHWWREALTLVERSPYTRRRASFGDVLLADACGRATIRPVLHTAPYRGTGGSAGRLALPWEATYRFPEWPRQARHSLAETQRAGRPLSQCFQRARCPLSQCFQRARRPLSQCGGRGATALPVGLRVKRRFLDAANCGGGKFREGEALGAKVFQ